MSKDGATTGTRGHIPPLLKGDGTGGTRKSKIDGSKNFLLASLALLIFFTSRFQIVMCKNGATTWPGGGTYPPLLKGGGTRGTRKSKTDGSKIFLLAFLQNFYHFTCKLLCPTVSLNANNYHNIHNFTLAFHFLIISLLRQKCRLNFYFTLYRCTPYSKYCAATMGAKFGKSMGDDANGKSESGLLSVEHRGKVTESGGSWSSRHFLNAGALIQCNCSLRAERW